MLSFAIAANHFRLFFRKKYIFKMPKLHFFRKMKSILFIFVAVSFVIVQNLAEPPPPPAGSPGTCCIPGTFCEAVEDNGCKVCSGATSYRICTNGTWVNKTCGSGTGCKYVQGCIISCAADWSLTWCWNGYKFCIFLWFFLWRPLFLESELVFFDTCRLFCTTMKL